MHENYTEAICIQGKVRANGVLHALTVEKAREFIAATRAALDQIRRTATGNRMLEEIDKSGHQLTIYRVATVDTGNSHTPSNAQKSTVIKLGKKEDGKTELHRVLQYACEDLSNRSRLQKFLGMGKPKPRFLKRDEIARLCGIPWRDFQAMEAGTKPIDDNTEYKLRVYLYHFLTPGPGDDSLIEFNHIKDNLSPEHRKYLPQSHNWQNRPPAIALAHECVHAWRSMNGLKIFPYGWEEEAMTVGLPPFAYMEFTENKIRIEWGGLAVRPDYLNIGIKSELISNMPKLGIGEKNAWQGNSSSLVAQTELSQAMRSRRAAMGYDDDDGF